MNHIKANYLPWNSFDQYWIILSSAGKLPKEVHSAIKSDIVEINNDYNNDEIIAIKCGENWSDLWQNIAVILNQRGLADSTKAVINTSQEPPSAKELSYILKPIDEISKIAENIWLGDSLLNDKIVAFLQPIIDRRQKIFGYEAFARAIDGDDNYVSGAEIINASKNLKIEYRIDRFLHHKAIEGFVDGNYDGSLFVNFLPGFIQKPDVYLEGLANEVKRYDITPSRIVLDLTKAELPRNQSHLMAIRDYCKKRGYLICLDDISKHGTAKKLIESLQPNFIKLDNELTDKANKDSNKAIITKLVSMAHDSGITVIAKNIEDANNLKDLTALNIDLFQGYHIGKPKLAL